jgi:hypothetical protein
MEISVGAKMSVCANFPLKNSPQVHVHRRAAVRRFGIGSERHTGDDAKFDVSGATDDKSSTVKVERDETLTSLF